jgi:TPR repeat protein
MRTAWLWAALALPAAADVVFLKNGQRLEGTLQEKGDSYELKTDLETLTIPKADVEKVVQSFEAFKAEGEARHKKGRALYDEAIKLGDGKEASEKLREGIKILKSVVALYYEARETYVDDKYASMDKDIVRLIQEIRLYKDKITVEIEAAPVEAKNPPPPPPPPPPPDEKKDPPAPNPSAPSLADRAKSGDVDAQLGLAAQLETERKWSEALQWLKTAAEKNARAQCRVGLFYLEGRGVKQDYREAARWFDKAAAAGCALGWFYIGTMHHAGRGFARSPQTADEWCEKASKQLKPEDPETTAALGWMTIEGMGAAQNRAKGLDLLKEAAGKGDLRAMTELGDRALEDKNRKEALDWYQKAADKGWPDAQTNAGEMNDQVDKAYLSTRVYNRRGGTPNYSKAAEWYRKAADQGYARAQFRLADLNRFGRGVGKDMGQALRLFTSAYENATEDLFAAACNGVGWFHLLGEGVSKNPGEAARWFKMAAESGDALGQSNLGSAYFERNPGEAVKWWVLAAKQGHKDAMNNLGFAYAVGKGVAKNVNEARRWLIMAIQAGSQEAKKSLQILNKQRR